MYSDYVFPSAVTTGQIAAARASVEPLSRQVAAALEAAGEGAILLAWLSDMHMRLAQSEKVAPNQGVDSSFNFRLALEEVGALQPAPHVLALGGDLSDQYHWMPEAHCEYDLLRAVLEAHRPPGIPTLPLLGNHDHGSNNLPGHFWEHYERWSLQGWPRPVSKDDFYYAAEIAGWRFLVLDTRSSFPNDRMPAAQRDWLERELAATPNTPTVVLQHRPHVRCGNWVDDHRFIDPACFALVSEARQVHAVVSGHTHKAAGWELRHQAHVIAPALYYGIDDVPGWACVILRPGKSPVVFVKELAHYSAEPNGEVVTAAGAVRPLPLAPWSADTL